VLHSVTMSSSSSDEKGVLKPTVERRALRASGLALAILSFQTLGMAQPFVSSSLTQ
jgi:hypothetical protein